MNLSAGNKNKGQRRLLITGAGGFVGPWLTRAALDRYGEDSRIVACTRGAENIAFHDTRLSLRQPDIQKPQHLNRLIDEIRPTDIIHLAAISHVPTANRDPSAVWKVNVIGTLNLLEAVQQFAPEATFLFVSSSEIYGRSFRVGKPLDENAVLQPGNPYATSKAAGDLMAGQYAEAGLRVIRARPFNHIGPGQSVDFVVSSFASQIAAIEQGRQPPELKVGNLDAARDFLDVRDVVEAYLDLLDHAPAIDNGSAFNICSGTARPIKRILDDLVSLSNAKFELVADQTRQRPFDTPVAVGDATKLRHLTGWQPQQKWSRTLEEILDHWRNCARL